LKDFNDSNIPSDTRRLQQKRKEMTEKNGKGNGERSTNCRRVMEVTKGKA